AEGSGPVSFFVIEPRLPARGVNASRRVGVNRASVDVRVGERAIVDGDMGMACTKCDSQSLIRDLQDRESRPERNTFRRPDGADAATFSSVLAAASRQRLSENA